MIKYLEIALPEVGTKEIAGPKATPRIVEYAKHTSLKATSDEVPWCSAFVNWVVDKAGDKGTGSAAARSWLDWGKVVPMDEIEPGDICIFDRKDKSNPNAAHVTFYVETLVGGFLRCVGGNQGDMVKMSNYGVDKLLGIRRPK
jgi:uncharacterized protein (TIGR02594 family)